MSGRLPKTTLTEFIDPLALKIDKLEDQLKKPTKNNSNKQVQAKVIFTDRSHTALIQFQQSDRPGFLESQDDKDDALKIDAMI